MQIRGRSAATAAPTCNATKRGGHVSSDALARPSWAHCRPLPSACRAEASTAPSYAGRKQPWQRRGGNGARRARARFRGRARTAKRAPSARCGALRNLPGPARARAVPWIRIATLATSCAPPSHLEVGKQHPLVDEGHALVAWRWRLYHTDIMHAQAIHTPVDGGMERKLVNERSEW